MVIDVGTKDCTALSDAELAEMADICLDGPAGFDIGAVVQAAGCLGTDNPGLRGRQAGRLLLLHP